MKKKKRRPVQFKPSREFYVLARDVARLREEIIQLRWELVALKNISLDDLRRAILGL
jgi:hypothetical protein